MRRHFSLVLLFVLALSCGAASFAWPQSQELALRGPRFIAAWKPSAEAVDASNAAVLRRRVSLDLANVTADEALKEITRQADLEITYSKSLLPTSRSVSLHARGITVAAALTEVLLDAPVDIAVARGGQLALVKRLASAFTETVATDSGMVRGRVTDQATGAPIVGVIVTIEERRQSATTNSDGQYRIAGVSPGTYTVRARYIGYAPLVVLTTVDAGREVTVDFALVKSVQVLNEVVTTGTVIETQRRALPTPVTVVTAEEIEGQQLRRVDQMFRTNVPGSISWDQGTSDYTNSITVRGTSSLLGSDLNSIKTYIDGIEASSDLFSIIDVNSIERVEIIRGPQASTVHGSGASSGVLQIFTKKGDFGLRSPEVTATASAGVVQSAYESSAQQDYSASLHGGSQDLSYHLGGSYSQTGEWVAKYSSRAPSFFAGGRLVQGPLILDLSARYMSRVLDRPNDPRLQVYSGFANDTEEYYTYQTYGLALSYRATRRWQHTLILGNDRSRQDIYNTRARADDNLFTVQSGPNDRVSLRYNTSLTLATGPALSGNVTAGVEYAHNDLTGFTAPGALQGAGVIVSDPAYTPVAYRIRARNTGYFAQAQFGLHDALFLTAGLRIEGNTNFGVDYGTAWAPRVGLSYVRPLGGVTAKLRASYGEGLRAPTSVENVDRPGTRANPNLGPEEQVGGDFGIDLYFGPKFSLAATYYDQTARGLIASVLVDPTTTPETFQSQNVGRIKNSGLELEARAQLGRLRLAGHYSLMNSHARELGPLYTGELQVGDRLLGVPKHSAGATANYAVAPGTSFTASVVYIGNWTEFDWLALYGVFFGGNPFTGSLRDYWIEYPAVAKVNLAGHHKLSSRVDVLLSVENLTNNLRSEQYNLLLTPGRRTTLGARVTY